MWLDILLLSSTLAAAGEHHDLAGGGLVLSPAWLPAVGPSGRLSAGFLPCVGGQGFEIDGWGRGGGEGHFCSNEEDMIAFGGASGGLAVHPGPVFLSATVGGGAGFLAVQEANRPEYAAAFLYLKPEVSAGLGLGWAAAELGLFAELGLPVATWQEEEQALGVPFAWGGTQVSLLFGEFWPHGDRLGAEEWTEVVPPTPPAPGGLPLAIPVDAPPPPPPPAPAAMPAELEEGGEAEPGTATAPTPTAEPPPEED